MHDKSYSPITVRSVKIERSLNIVVEFAIIFTLIIERLRRSPVHVAKDIRHTSRGIMLYLPVGGVSVFVKRKAEGVQAVVVCHSVIAGLEIPVVAVLC